MNRSLFSIVSFAVTLLAGLSSHVSAQTAEDSVLLVNGSWNTVKSRPGLLCKKIQVDLFGTNQMISYMEVDPDLFQVAITQDTKRRWVGKLGRDADALAAVNGGYFQTNTNRANAAGFVKINGSILSEANDFGNAGFAIDANNRLHFTDWNSDMNSSAALWHRDYPSVMVAGPMLLTKYVNRSNAGDTARHPRTIIGTKKNGTVVLMVVDGRQKGADGMSFYELAAVCRFMGMEHALNLDGGGSSAMWLSGSGYVNSPSDDIIICRIPRAVCNAVVIKAK